MPGGRAADTFPDLNAVNPGVVHRNTSNWPILQTAWSSAPGRCEYECRTGTWTDLIYNGSRLSIERDELERPFPTR